MDGKDHNQLCLVSLVSFRSVPRCNFMRNFRKLHDFGGNQFESRSESVVLDADEFSFICNVYFLG